MVQLNNDSMDIGPQWILMKAQYVLKENDIITCI